MKPFAVVAVLAAAAGVFAAGQSRSVFQARQEEPRLVPAPALDLPAADAATEVAVFAGGCFWGVQGVYQHTRGVVSAVSGYAGGEKQTADYDRVGTGTTGHAESVQVIFDPRQISYGRLLQLFFSVAHDPTEVNRQGPDEGTQYRTEIFAATPEQEAAARAYIAQLDAEHIFAAPIATKVEPLKGFYPAEDFHQDYLVRNPHSAYIRINDLPKIAALKRVWPDYYREKPVLLAEN